MKRDISIYLKDILENMERIETFTSGKNYDDFSNDEKTHFAVIRCIEIIGEATKHVPDSIRHKYPEIPWKDMAGMRDKVIHFYFGVNLERVWLTVTEDIPEIKPLIEKVLYDYKKL
ncbi:MAG: DUF86 domain-containing protein [Methanobacteriaceae archaeon]|jgi:uncharacterized protein with HEPN domain